MYTCFVSQTYNSHMSLESRKLPSLLVDIEEGVVDLGWGHPSPFLHPLEDIEFASRSLFASNDSGPLQYGATQGYGPFLESLSRFLSGQPAYGIEIDPADLFLTAGASQGLDLASTLFAKAGDTVLVEEPTYFVIEKIFREHHLHVSGIPTDDQGLMVSVLREKLESGVRPKFIYTIPTYQNPTGASMSEERRSELVKLAEEYDFYIFADEVYQLIHFNQLPPKPIGTFDEHGRVISFGSFSKILAPGLRAGWIHSSDEIISRFADAAVTFSGGGFNHFASALIKEVIDLGLLDSNVQKLRSVYSERSDTMGNVLLEEFGDIASFQRPEGGYYYWLKFPGGFDTESFLPLAEDHGVSFRPGNAFSESGRFTSHLRLTYARLESADLAEGIRRLSNAYRSI
mgnify:FL=1